MTHDPSVWELIVGTKQLIADKEALEEMVKYYQSTVAALEADNREYARRLDRATASNGVTTISPSLDRSERAGQRSVKETDWMCNWLHCAEDKTVLTPVEEAWREGKAQHALSLLTPIIRRQDIAESERVDAYLLQSSILRATGDLSRALSQAEKALSVATRADLHRHMGKANFYRGSCYANMDELANAFWCYTLAAHTAGYEELIQTNRDIVERTLKSIPKGDRRRQLTID